MVVFICICALCHNKTQKKIIILMGNCLENLQTYILYLFNYKLQVKNLISRLIIPFFKNISSKTVEL